MVARGKTGPKGVVSQAGTNFRDYLKQIELDKTRASEAQRIAALPDEVLTKALELSAGHFPRHWFCPVLRQWNLKE
jgi:hypothetical protein